MPEYRTLEFTDEFLAMFGGRDFTSADRRAFIRAFRLLDDNERHPSLRVHDLTGPLQGLWSASASSTLRIVFERLESGRKRLISCSKHYDRRC
jgi:mRNA-degrading endonuclease YafQ of YafQ-DinJ toxin-antitoxin module